ncbi:MAG: DEAD/DEAH box helicase [Lysobacterales bacterium]
MKSFHPATRQWFEENFEQPTAIQKKGWDAIIKRQHCLLVAPTGSGKTLAAFLAGIDRLGQTDAEQEPGIRVLYISPLKALVYDIERNLRAPLVGISRVAERLDQAFRSASVAVRTGDTPQRERQQQAKHPPQILVTTPESLFLILGSKAAENLRTVETVIIDEIHALAPTKRGAHLALSLERLAALTPEEPQRVGLSATVRPLDTVAKFLGGKRPIDIIDCSAKPNIDVVVSVPVPDMQNPPVQPKPDSGGSILGELYSREVGTPQAERGIWPAIYPQLLSAIEGNHSTIVFVNSRGLCERLAQKLNELADAELVRAHHGSISHAKRSEIEEGLKSGAIRGIVATSSLELGIDMGSVDLVILVESPGSAARGLQRVGRAGHGVGEKSHGKIFPKFRGDLLESAVVAQRMLSAELEGIEVPVNPLDVLAQQIVAQCCSEPHTVEEIAALVAGAWSYRDLSSTALEGVLDMLSGRYPSNDFADLRPLLSWDRSNDTLSPRRGAAMVTRMNAGTIPDRGAYGVHLGEDGPRVGELDEEMVFETRVGDNIMLGASTWRVDGITRDRVIVAPAPGEPGRLPFWRGDGPGRPIELGQAIGEFLRKAGRFGESKARAWIADNTPLDEMAVSNLAAYVQEQKTHSGTLPTDRNIVIEKFRDELGDWRVCILTPFGARIHAPWAMALQRTLGELAGFEMQVMYTDDGIVLRLADTDELPALDALIPSADDVDELITDQLSGTALFAGLFRENAVRSLLLRRNRPGQRSPLWAQRLKSQNLMAAVRQYPSFPIVMETYRQALGDVFDLPGLKSLLRDIASRQVSVDDIETPSASPFAKSLVFAYVAAYLYEQDAPLAERKAQALTLDRALLGELLGQAELRDLIDRDVLEQLEAELQRLTDDYQARDADDLHDLLRRLGELTQEELQQRSPEPVEPWLESLKDQRRAIPVSINEQPHWIAAEDAGLYRDALGTVAPGGLPDAFMDPVDGPLERLARRYARHRGPFLTRQPAQRWGLRPAQLEPVLTLLEQRGVLVKGEIRPGGAELDWCDAQVLRRLKRRNLASLRDEVAAVDTPALALFLPSWQGLTAERGGEQQLREIIGQLQDLALPWSTLSTVILPRRVPGFRLEMLDMLAAAGAVVWVGRGASGPKDGRVALYLREQVRHLLPTPQDYEPASDVHGAIIHHLQTHGASFSFEIQAVVEDLKTEPPYSAGEFNQALWDLVWDGQVTNDTFSPFKSLTLTRRRTPRRGQRYSQASQGPSASGGRWSLVSSLLSVPAKDTERALARARLLLDRYGVVSRQCAQAEDLPGGFSAIYKVLRELAEQGRCRRGHFVDGLNGAQFALAGAVDQLRAARSDAEERDNTITDDEIQVLCAIDPANPFGALVPWPECADVKAAKPRRVAGAWVLLARGQVLFFVTSRNRHIVTFPAALDAIDGALDGAISKLRHLPKTGKRSAMVVLEKIDGKKPQDSPLLDAFRQRGFSLDYGGLIDMQPAGTQKHA